MIKVVKMYVILNKVVFAAFLHYCTAVASALHRKNSVHALCFCGGVVIRVAYLTVRPRLARDATGSSRFI